MKIFLEAGASMCKSSVLKNNESVIVLSWGGRGNTSDGCNHLTLNAVKACKSLNNI